MGSRMQEVVGSAALGGTGLGAGLTTIATAGTAGALLPIVGGVVGAGLLGALAYGVAKAVDYDGAAEAERRTDREADAPAGDETGGG